MKYVIAKFKFLSILGLAALITTVLTGCEDPAVEVGTLGKKLSAPTLKGTSPFDQSFETQKYVHVSGVCDARVGDVSISFKIAATSTSSGGTVTTPSAVQIENAGKWYTPPSTPDLTGTSLTGPITNDVNCADGAFDFYLTKNDLFSLWGFDGTTIDVDVIYLKGSTLIGDTQILSLVDPKNGNGSGNTTVATKIVIEKQWPRGFAGSGHCESFNVSLTDGNGNSASATSAVTFSLSQKISTATPTTLVAYTSWDLCNKYFTTALTPGVSTFSIPAGKNSIQVIVPMSQSANAFDQTITLTPVSSNLNAGADTYILRDQASTRRWVAADPNSGMRFRKDVCYPINFNRYQYTGALDSSATSVSVQPSAANSKLKYYSDSTCSTVVNAFVIAPSTSSIGGFLRYNSDATDVVDQRINVSFTTTDSTYDYAPFFVNIDMQGALTISRVDLWGPNEIDRASCSAYMVAGQNNRYSILPAAADIQVSLATTAAGSFYTSADCIGTATTQVTISQGHFFSPVVYFKGTDATVAGVYSLTASSSGYTSTPRDLTVIQPIANHVSLNPTVTPSKNTCIPVKVYPMDALGVLAPVGSLSFNYTVTGTYASMTKFYSDANCTADAKATALSPAGANYYTVYLQSSTPESVTFFSVLVTFSNGLTGNTNTNITWQ